MSLAYCVISDIKHLNILLSQLRGPVHKASSMKTLFAEVGVKDVKFSCGCPSPDLHAVTLYRVM